jgi:hypothetical protein
LDPTLSLCQKLEGPENVPYLSYQTSEKSWGDDLEVAWESTNVVVVEVR